jgi:hypothetical protein
MLPAPLAFLVGGVLIGLAIYFLSKTLYRTDYLVGIGIFGGFIPFTFGLALILFGFLSDAPPIFGFIIGHW